MEREEREQEKSTAPHESQQLVSTAREEAIQELLTELIKLRKEDHEREDMIEGGKILVEASKTQILASSGVLLAMAAISSNLLTELSYLWVLFVAFGLILASVVFALMQMTVMGGAMAGLKPDPPFPMYVLYTYSAASPVSFLLGLVSFAVFIALNLV